MFIDLKQFFIWRPFILSESETVMDSLGVTSGWHVYTYFFIRLFSAMSKFVMLSSLTTFGEAIGRLYRNFKALIN